MGRMTVKQLAALLAAVEERLLALEKKAEPEAAEPASTETPVVQRVERVESTAPTPDKGPVNPPTAPAAEF